MGVTVQDADDGDTTTCVETLIEAAERVEAVRPDGEGIEEIVSRRHASRLPPPTTRSGPLHSGCGRVGRIEIRAFLEFGPVGLSGRQAEDE